MSRDQMLAWMTRNGFERADAIPTEGLPDASDAPRFYMPVFAETKAAATDNEEEGRIHVVLTTPIPDRGGDVVVPKGVQLKWFKKNPVVLWAHNYLMPPIGVVDVKTLEVTDAGIEADVLFDMGGVAGREIYRLFKAGILRAFSVGFITLKHELVEDIETRRIVGYRITKWELIELSAVPIPANPEALAKQLDEIEGRAADEPSLCVVKALRAAVAPPTPEPESTPPDWAALAAKIEAASESLKSTGAKIDEMSATLATLRADVDAITKASEDRNADVAARLADSINRLGVLEADATARQRASIEQRQQQELDAIAGAVRESVKSAVVSAVDMELHRRRGGV